MSKVKNAIKSICTRAGQAEKRINDFEDRNFKITQKRKHKKQNNIKKSEESLPELLSSIRKLNLRITGSIFKEIIAENFQNLGKDLDI